MSRSRSRTRWLEAQNLEAVTESADDIREWVRVRTDTWARLVHYLDQRSLVKKRRRILDVGGKATTIFLALPGSHRYAVDPVYGHLFEQHPFLGDLEQYRGVTFVALPVEELVEEPFDLIFCINALDHVSEVDVVASRLKQLLAPGGVFVLIVDCYADKAVRDLVRWFDVDVPHPHHFVVEDIPRIFRGLRLRGQDNLIFKLFFSGTLFRNEQPEIGVYQFGRLLERLGSLLSRYGRPGDLWFAAKFSACYVGALLLGLFRRKERPIHPLKKPRLFVFEKYG